MSLARVKVWNPGDVLTANDLNAEFNNILNNPGSLISPLTGNLDLGNFQLVRARLENVTTTQAAGQIGRAMFNTSDNMVNIDDGSAIRRVPTIISSAMAPGDLITASTAATPTWQRLPLGSSGAYLTAASSGQAVWGATFVSTDISITFNSGTTLNHSIGALPGRVEAVLRLNTSAVGGYSTGDEVPVVGTISESNAAAQSCMFSYNATTATFTVGGAINILNKASGAAQVVTSSAWVAVIRAWA